MLQGITITLALIIVVLSIPLSLNFFFITNQGSQGYVRYNWFFGLITFQKPLPAPSQSPTKVSTQLKSSKPSKRKLLETTTNHKSRNSKNVSLALLKQSIFRRHILKFVKRIYRASHAKDLYLKLRIGLGDPADTGELWAIMGPISGILTNMKNIKIELQPEFIDAVMEIESHGQFRFIPLHLIVLVMLFTMSPTTIRAWRILNNN